MLSFLVSLFLVYIQTIDSRISLLNYKYNFNKSRINTFPRNVIIEIPTTIKGNLEARYIGIKPNFTSQEALEWWEREAPGYYKFVSEQIKLSAEERKKRPSPIIPKTEEILEKLGSWGHYYDWGTKEIASWEKKNPPAPNLMPLLGHYKKLKAEVLAKQKHREMEKVTEFCSELKREREELLQWAKEEEKAGRLKCECKNTTDVTKFTERYTPPADSKWDGRWREGLWSLEKE
ncbi:hypothetical protein WDU94_005241 [Cyamophila willieti]